MVAYLRLMTANGYDPEMILSRVRTLDDHSYCQRNYVSTNLKI